MLAVEILIIVFSSLAMFTIAAGWLYFLVKAIKQRKEAKTKFEQEVEILKLEFDYAKESSIQAQKDRLSIVNFYIGLFSGVTTLTFGLKQLGSDEITRYIPIVFFLLGIVSYVFVLLMVRLRQVWIESIKAMNTIKKYFFEKNYKLKEFIIWTMDTMPKAEQFKTINYMSSILISLLGTVSISIGLILIDVSSIIVFVISLAFFFFSIASYHLMLKYKI